MPRTLSYWLKQRTTPQSPTYFVLCGQITKKEARAKEDTVYGCNIMLEFRTLADYEAAIARLKQTHRVFNFM